MNEIWIIVGFICFFLLLLVVTEYLLKEMKVKPEYTRKIGHFVSTISTLPFPLLFHDQAPVLILAGASFLLLLGSFLSKKYLRSIHDIERFSAGSFLLPVAIYLVFLFAEVGDTPGWFYLPILVLAISDPLAGIAGTMFREKTRPVRIFSWNLKKTYLGSAAFLLSSLLICLLFLTLMTELPLVDVILYALILSLVSTLVELLSVYGFDNLLVPLSLSGLLMLMI